MVRFSAKKINRQLSFGEILRSAREDRGLSLKQVSFKLKIPTTYLEGLEEEVFNQLPAGSYGRHFIREYARFLDLNIAEVIKEYDDRLNYWQRFSVKKSNTTNKQSVDWLKNKWIVFGGVLLALLLYLIYGAGQLFLRPSLTIFNPPVNFITDDLEINVVGITKPGAVLLINGAKVVVDNEGRFNQVVTLQPGINVITASVRRVYSSTLTLNREVLVSTLPQNGNP